MTKAARLRKMTDRELVNALLVCSEEELPIIGDILRDRMAAKDETDLYDYIRFRKSSVNLPY